MKKNQWFILISLLISLCLVCGIAIFVINSVETPIPTATSASESNINIIIANTSNAAQTQTAMVAPPSSTAFVYTTPSFTIPTLAVTWTPIPTDTPFILTLITFPANNQTSQCSCTEDVYNCGDALEQVCFNYCNSNGYGDIHRLDQDNDGIACDNP